MRRPRLRAVVASTILIAPSRHGCRRHTSSEGPAGELPVHRGSECTQPPLERQPSRACPPLESAGVRAGLRSAADAMSDAMGKAVWQAAYDGNEPELKRLIRLGGNVNWHNPEVRRRMRLAWAPASFRLYMHSEAAYTALPPPPRPPTRRSFPTALRAAASALAEPPPRRHAELRKRALDGPAGRADSPRAPAEVGLPVSMYRPRGTDRQRCCGLRGTGTKDVSRSSLRPMRTSTTRR